MIAATTKVPDNHVFVYVEHCFKYGSKMDYEVFLFSRFPYLVVFSAQLVEAAVDRGHLAQGVYQTLQGLNNLLHLLHLAVVDLQGANLPDKCVRIYRRVLPGTDSWKIALEV